MDHGYPGCEVPEGIGRVVLGSELQGSHLHSGRESGCMLLLLCKLSEARFESNGAVSFVEEILRLYNLQVAACFLSTLSDWFLM